ncbi:hypothetical protein GWG65_17015 [Bradyrhizobium sp. CSA207]|uniref:hypothetical protein n=1 Tax=Bradyrhizobium sp. CSA207 TaxID=2698826 RepID=UPI0023B073F3|nr:hypothetical protein [Bradyrhizobium sp. CSA207]MDE5443126.1 hypothetical protein [Bradyrhizobium sp. CSA207]
MAAALAIHILAAIIWLGGLFLLCVVLQPSVRPLDPATALSLWHRVLSRFLVWGWISLVLILTTGITMVFLEFGGFANIPSIHRANMVIGIPAIALYGYLYFAPWQRFRRALSSNGLMATEGSIRQVRILMATILALGLVASVVSAGARYYG